MSAPIHEAERRETSYFLRRLYRMGLTTTSGGNVSMRIGRRMLTMTASATDKARIRAGEIAVMGLDGANLTPGLKPSSESLMHIKIYEARPDVRAIVHAHPPTATLFTTSATPIRTGLIAESHCMLGRLGRAPYKRTNTPELAEAVAKAARQAEYILMDNHGVTTLGVTLLQAFDRLELLEQAARMTLMARHLDGVSELDATNRAELDAMMQGMTKD